MLEILKKINVFYKIVLGMLLSTFVFNLTSFGYVHYGEIQDEGIRVAMEGVRTYTVHFTNFMFYTINVGTPGFIEQGVYNSRLYVGDGNKLNGSEYEINIKPFYRWRAGPMVETNNLLDFYIDANSRGFFTIQMPTTIAFTRDGRFKVDSKGRLVTLSGNYPVLGEDGEIILPATNDVLVSRSGMIFVDGQPLTKFKIAVFKSFKEMQSLDDLNGSFFVLTEDLQFLEGPEHYAVVQGFLEQNNVLKGITGDMLGAKNSYDVSIKTAQLINRALSTAASLSAP